MQFDFENQIKKKTDQELTDIFINAKDYNPEFVKLAEQELNARNINLDVSKRVKDKTLYVDTKQLLEGKAGSPLYIFLCFALAFLGGLIAIFAGYIYGYSKTKGHDGKEFYVYNEQTRNIGKLMMWLGIAVFFYFLLRQELSI